MSIVRLLLGLGCEVEGGEVEVDADDATIGIELFSTIDELAPISVALTSCASIAASVCSCSS